MSRSSRPFPFVTTTDNISTIIDINAYGNVASLETTIKAEDIPRCFVGDART